jgi:hypothetical protein
MIQHVAIEYKAPEIKEDSGVARAVAAAEAQLNGNLARHSPPNPYPKKVDQQGQPYYRAWRNEPMWGYPGEDRLMVLVEFQKHQSNWLICTGDLENSKADRSFILFDVRIQNKVFQFRSDSSSFVGRITQLQLCLL